MFWGWISDPGRKSPAKQNIATYAGTHAKGERAKKLLAVEKEPFYHGQGTQARDLTMALLQRGFSIEEVRSLCKLQEWYQSGGSDRASVLYHLEFLKRLVARGILER